MSATIPHTMRAAAIDRFGGPEVLRVRPLPVPTPRSREVLIRLTTAAVGVWDPLVRSGELAFGPISFPFIMGNDGAGIVVAAGTEATRFRVGDRVYACSLEVGFYAEYVALHEDFVAPVPPGLKLEEAGALGADGITALRGLDDHLRVRAGDRVIVYGASGGVGHLAVQLLKRLGAQVFAVASGDDGVELVRQLGADGAANGRGGNVVAAGRALGGGVYDAALVLANGPGLDELLRLVRPGGRIAYPNGVEPVPPVPDGVTGFAYDGVLDAAVFTRLNTLIGSAPFHVRLWRLYDLEEAERAHREVSSHHLGKLAFRFWAA